MTFRENLNNLCKRNNTTLTNMVKELGISTSKVTAINRGSIPSEEMMLSFAKYLECSVMDFFADEENLHETKPANEDEEDLLRIYRGLSRRTKHEFMSMVYEYETREELEGDKGATATTRRGYAV